MEFALVAPIAMLIVLSILEIGILSFMSASLETAVAAAARTIRTGQADGPTSATQFKTVICDAMADSAVSCQDKMAISVRRFTSFSNLASATESPPMGEFDRGQAGDVMLVKVTYRWPLLTPFMDRLYQPADGADVLLDARIAFRNEPYS